MLARNYRLPAAAKLRQATIVQTQFFSLRFAKNNLPESRFGFIISKRIAKGAVVRNRTKRRLRACIENRLRKIEKGYDMLFLLRKEAVDATTQILSQSLENTLMQQNLSI